MDFLGHPHRRSAGKREASRAFDYLRYAVSAALVGAAAYVAPAIWATDRSLFGLVSFDQLTFVLSMVLAYAALRVDDAAVRVRLGLGVIVAFALGAGLLLGFSSESLALVVLALTFGLLELPRPEPHLQAY